jgi:sugar lactone lactonase YvrE
MRPNQMTLRRRRPFAEAIRKLRPLTLAFAIACTSAAFSTASAAGAITHPIKGIFGTVPSSVGGGIAVDAANGNVFVTDTAKGSVQIFGAEGGAPSGVAVSKIEGFDFPGSNLAGAVAIDNSATSPSRGALYVADREDVKKLTLNPLSEEYELAGTLNGAPALEQPEGLAVDADGNVFVTDQHNSFIGSIVEFNPAGAEIARFEATEASGTFKSAPSRLDFDSAGNLYVLGFFGGLWKFTANGAGKVELGTTDPSQLPDPGARDLAIDRDTDTLYAATESRIVQYDVSCLPQCPAEREFGFGTIQRTTGIGVSPINGDIYVGDSGAHHVVHFGADLAVVPDAFTESASGVTQTSATLRGAVSADGGPPASCEFQYTTKASFEAENFVGASTAPCSPAGPFTGSGKEAVEADIAGLAAETTYRYRLRAFNENGPGFGQTLSFATVGKPKIGSATARATTNSATVEGLINPNGGPGAAQDTTFVVEYVSADEFDANGYANAIVLPPGGEAIGSGFTDVKVSQRLDGLAVGGSYHFRIVAENEAGQTIGADNVFQTYTEQPAGLPDGRVYEQVTPVHKNGAAPTFLPGSDQATADGEGIAYLSNGGFPGTEGGQGFPTFFANRGSDWSSQGVLPPGSVGAIAGVLGWSEDLSRAYLVQGSLPGDQLSFLERDSAAGALRTLAAEGNTNVGSAYFYVDSARDGSVVFFESEDTPATAKAPAVFNTYAWIRATGELVLAGALPGGSPPAKGSPAGSPSDFHGQILQDEHAVSSDGSSLFFRDAGTGQQLYLRINPAVEEEECGNVQAACTVQVSKSQRTPVDPLDPKGKKPARFWQATPDGSLAFFTSPAKLTDDATTGANDEGNDLYRYDAESGELIDLVPDPSDPAGANVQGVLGASEDGSSVYFAANGVLAAGATPGDCAGITQTTGGTGSCNLYRWNEGAITFLAPLSLGEGSDSANWSTVGAGGGRTSRLSADGQTLLFRSQERLTSYDNQGVPVFYRYSAADGKTLCVSCNPTGAAPSQAPATLQSFPRGLGNVPPASVLSRNLSADGSRVFFESPDKLIATDVNGDEECPQLSGNAGEVGLRACQDVYEWEAKGSGSCESEAQNGGCLYLISDGRSSEPAFFADADLTGENAFFFTDRALVGQDKDQIRDIYTARVGGGIASQNPPLPPPPCEGEACKGSLGETPPTQTPGSERFSGPGNQKPSHHKKKKPHKKKNKKRHATRKHG